MPRKMDIADARKMKIINKDANGKIIEDLSKVNLAEVDPERNEAVAKILCGVVKC